MSGQKADRGQPGRPLADPRVAHRISGRGRSEDEAEGEGADMTAALRSAAPTDSGAEHPGEAVAHNPQRPDDIAWREKELYLERVSPGAATTTGRPVRPGDEELGSQGGVVG